jgi:hypothetical protein
MINRRVIVCGIVILLLIILFVCMYNSEGFRGIAGGLIPLVKQPSKKKPIVNTPIEDLRSRLKVFKDFVVPEFLCYNFDILSTVENQGKICGSCWAFVVSGVMGDRISIHKNKRFDMSSQHLLQCYNYPDGCDGDTPENVFEWMEATGFKLTFNRILPYRQSGDDMLSGGCPSPPPVGIDVKQNSLYRIVNTLDAEEPNQVDLLENIKNMKIELLESGPFFATIIVYDDFYNFVEDAPYVSNFLKFVGGHAITVVGYVDPLVDPRPGYNDGYWICRNSWGTTWPKGSPPHPGYFTIAMGINMCGIESRCGGIDPNISLEDIDPGSTYTSFTKYAAEYEA